MTNQHYRVKPVTGKERNLGHWDLFATWFGANANNGTWYIGGIIAACGLMGGLFAMLLASVLSYLFLSLVSQMGYETGLSTTTLSRATFGIRGSVIPSLINFIMFMGWTAVNTFIAGTSLSFIFHGLFGWPAYGQVGGEKGLVVGILLMSVLHLLSIISGQKSVRLIERIGILLVILFVFWESVVVLKHVSIARLYSWVVPAKDQMPFGSALDILAAFNLAWVTSSADFSRFAQSKTVSTISSFWGALLGVIVFAAMGLSTAISLALTTGAYNPNNSDPSTIANELGMGTLAMVVIVLTSMTSNAVNLQAAGSALSNLYSRLSLRSSLLIATVIATLLTFIPLLNGNFLDVFEAFLNYIGMLLGPIIAIMVVDYFFFNKKDYVPVNFEAKQGPFWYRAGYNWGVIVLFVLGVLLNLFLSSLTVLKRTTGATFIVMIIIGMLYAGLLKLESSKSL
ncbi:cytosine permease [Fructobacillus sp. M1-13]|uniref:Cytosine permease n=1 Tax=Fructobacillus papyriferae TaxID=2713171 RepID=A0ABS5QNQ5_9LACO|nr:cytosine permease [Fructobacillus papyriferae]MBS9334731.1 cytosine permease [Fructobacillus papyriferae]MCD2158721.1 cytosine permease [Fructobacillus papyriferae]